MAVKLIFAGLITLSVMLISFIAILGDLKRRRDWIALGFLAFLFALSFYLSLRVDT